MYYFNKGKNKLKIYSYLTQNFKKSMLMTCLKKDKANKNTLMKNNYFFMNVNN